MYRQRSDRPFAVMRHVFLHFNFERYFMNIIFASGFLFPQTFLGQSYFRGLKDHLPDDILPLFPVVPATASIEERARRMGSLITEALRSGTLNDQQKIHIVAHSMGGLDARVLIATNANLRGATRSLTTIGTPHQGSPVADAIIGPEKHDLLDLRQLIGLVGEMKLRLVGFNLSGLRELTTWEAAKFNERYRERGLVECFSIAGIGHRTAPATSPILAAPYKWIAEKGNTNAERSNDGLVPRSSAEWDNALPPWEADHLEQVGYDLNLPGRRGRFDYLQEMDIIIQRLRTL